jgi:hypothetical protein
LSSALLALSIAGALAHLLDRLAAIGDCENLIELGALVVGSKLFLERLKVLAGRFA